VENRIVVSIKGGKVFAQIESKVYLLEEAEKQYSNGYTGYVLPNGNENRGTILVKTGTKNYSPVALAYQEREGINAKFDKFSYGEYKVDKLVGSIYTPIKTAKAVKSGKANAKIAKGSKAVASHTGKANKAVMAEILATQAHLAELIASIS